MIQKGLVSVVMPIYNGEQYLPQAIESALAQSYSRFELVIVDDGSTDNTAAIARSYSDPRIRYHYQENRGQTAALNSGLDLSEGEHVTTLDADDWLSADSLKIRVDYLDRHAEFGVCYGDGIYCNASGEPFLRFTEHMLTGEEGDVYDNLVVSPFYGTGASVLVRRGVLDQHGIRYDDRIAWCQDWDFYIRLAEKTLFGFVNAPVIYYRMHSNGMTMTMARDSRCNSLLQLRFKALNSPRFLVVSESQKRAFFYDLLITDLEDRISDQEHVFRNNAFRMLPRHQRSFLLRAVALSYFMKNSHMEIVRRWARSAWVLAPFDPKNAFWAISKLLSPGVGRRLVRKWQKARSNPGILSPFEIAGVQLQKQITRNAE